MIEQPIGRAPALDLGRFVAALAVYLFHALYLDPLAGRSPWTSSAAHVASYGNLGVEYFFMLSGFVICWSAEGNSRREFAINRFARLFPAFLLCASLSSLVLWVLDDPVSPARFLANLTFQAKALGFDYIDRVYWSLAAETLFYAAVFLIAIGPNLRRNLRIAIICWGILAVLPIAGWPMVLLNLQWAAYFSVGIALFLWRSEGRQIDRILFYVFVVLSAHEIYVRTGQVGKELAIQPQPIVAAGIVLILGLSLPWLTRVRMGKRIERITFIAGGLSYPLYLLHNEFNRPLTVMAWEIGMAAVVAANLFLLATIYAVFRVEIPLRKMLRAIDGRRKDENEPIVIEPAEGSGKAI